MQRPSAAVIFGEDEQKEEVEKEKKKDEEESDNDSVFLPNSPAKKTTTDGQLSPEKTTVAPPKTPTVKSEKVRLIKALASCALLKKVDWCKIYKKKLQEISPVKKTGTPSKSPAKAVEEEEEEDEDEEEHDDVSYKCISLSSVD